MRRTLLTVLSVLAVISLTTSAVFAGTGSFNGGVGFKTGSLIGFGKYVGYGGQDLWARLIGDATVLAMCQNKGGKQAPGRNPLSVTTSSTDILSYIQNGTAPVELTAADPSTFPFVAPSPTPKEAGCPNGNWTVEPGPIPGSTVWTGARITIRSGDASGDVLFDECYAFDPNLVVTIVDCTTAP